MKLALIFTDHMVFQKGMPIKVFGEGQGTGKIVFCGKVKEFVSEEEHWCVTLPAMEYGGPYEMTIYLNDKENTLKIFPQFTYTVRNSFHFDNVRSNKTRCCLFYLSQGKQCCEFLGC